MADLPFELEPELALLLRSALDVEGKIARALEALGPVADRDVVVVGGGPDELDRLARGGARTTATDPWSGSAWNLPDRSADAVVAAWSAFRGVDPDEIAECARILRPGGRLLVLHDYGRDDVSRLRGDRPEYSTWSRRDGPFLSSGFRIRVLHCFWTFESLESAEAFLGRAFGDASAPVVAGLKRPRLSWNVAVYHRSFGAEADGRRPALAASA